MTSGRLNGYRILVVEDNAPLSVFLEKALHDAGAEVVGPAATLSRARELASSTDELSAALLDIRLHAGEEVWQVARILAKDDVPFVFYTGHFDSDMLPPEWSTRPLLTKPSSIPVILGALANAASRGGELRASPSVA